MEPCSAGGAFQKASTSHNATLAPRGYLMRHKGARDVLARLTGMATVAL